MEAPPVQESRTEATARLFAERRHAGARARRHLEEELVRLNMRVAADVSRRFRGRGIAADDLEQVAYVGLVKAIRGFDPDRGHDFLSYAVPTIRGELRRHFRDLGWSVRPPRTIQEAQTRILGIEGELIQELGRSPRPTELAQRLGVGVDLVVDALGANGCFTPVSLDAAVDEDDEPLTQRLGGDDEGYAVAEARAMLAPVLAGLSQRERRIVELRFVRGCTQAEIGEAIGVTQMQVSRLLARLMARMREQLTVTRAA